MIFFAGDFFVSEAMKVYSVRLPVDLVDRIDGDRSGFIRAAIEARLSGSSELEPVKGESDADLVRDVLGGKVLTERALAKELGWPLMRVQKALKGLGVEYVGGGVRVR